MKCLRCENLFIDENDYSGSLTCPCCYATWLDYESYLNEKNGFNTQRTNDGSINDEPGSNTSQE
jgi:uncharacterized C2H2 Zn-finger protein